MLFQIGPIKIHWYGVFYAISFLIGYFYVKLLIKKNKWQKVDEKFLDDFLFFVMLGVLVGGRLGYVFFYNFSYFLHYPWKVFFIREGGMAFAGAFIGVALSLYFLSKKYKINFLSLTDLVVSILPLGLGLGRIGNYINGELFGKGCPNYLIGTFMCQKFGTTNFHFANQLLESLLEGWLLLLIFQYLVWKKNWLKKEGYLTVFFVIYYSVVRFFLEFIRWHPQDYIVLGFLSRSQVFMIVFFVAGLILLLYLNKRENV